MIEGKRDIEVPIPSISREYSDSNPGSKGRKVIVDVHYDNGKPKKIRIGRKSRDGFMLPNHKYFLLHRGEYEQYRSECEDLFAGGSANLAPEAILSVGLYAVVLAIVLELGLYDILIQSYGVQGANAILDYALFLIRTGGNATHKMVSDMSSYVLFTNIPYSDAWYSEFFSDRTCLNNTNRFLDLWINHWINRGISDVYISIDGSNVDCESEKNEDARHGYNKSGTHDPILSFMWIVVSSGEYKGMPLGYITYDGGQVDCMGIKGIFAKLKGSGLKVKGAILDRGFCTIDTMDGLSELGIPFTIMMKDDVGGRNAMMDEHSESLRTVSEYYIGKRRFGIVDHKRVFKTGSVMSWIALIYNPVTAGYLSTDFLDGLHEEEKRVQNSILAGKKYTVRKKYQEYIVIKTTLEENRVVKSEVSLDHEKVNSALRRFGYSAIASRSEKSAKEISEVYDLRSSAELAFKYFKTPLGGSEVRVHTKVSASNKMNSGCVATIIYNRFQQLCASVGLDASQTVIDLDKVQYTLTNGSYTFSLNYSKKIQVLLNKIGVTAEMLEKFSAVINERYIHHYVRDHDYINNTLLPANTPIVFHLCNGDNAPGPWDYTIPSCASDLDSQLNMQTDAEQSLLTSGERSTSEIVAEVNDFILGDISTDPVGDKESLAGVIVPLPPKKRGRPKGSKDTKPRVRRTNADLGKPYKADREKVPPEHHSKMGRPYGSRDSYKRVRRTNAQLGKQPRKASQ